MDSSGYFLPFLAYTFLQHKSALSLKATVAFSKISRNKNKPIKKHYLLTKELKLIQTTFLVIENNQYYVKSGEKW